MANIKRPGNTRFWQECGPAGNFIHCWWVCKLGEPTLENWHTGKSRRDLYPYMSIGLKEIIRNFDRGLLFKTQKIQHVIKRG